MADIYRSASEVIVWLGEGPAYIKPITSIAAAVETTPTSAADLDSSAGAALQLLSCDCWARTWVIQEFMLAPSMALYWGKTKFGFNDLRTIMRVGAEQISRRHCHAPTLLPRIWQIKELGNQRRIIQSGASIIVYWKHVLTLSSHTVCQDPRDRIYALSVSLTQNSPLRPITRRRRWTFSSRS